MSRLLRKVTVQWQCDSECCTNSNFTVYINLTTLQVYTLLDDR